MTDQSLDTKLVTDWKEVIPVVRPFYERFFGESLPEDFKRYQGRFYCEETGMYLAAKEMGLEDQLEPRNELCAFGRALMWFFKVNRYYDNPRREKVRQQLKESDNLDLPAGIAQMVEDLQ